MKSGHVKSLNFAVREAIELYNLKVEKENLKKEMEAASKDPLFLKDLNTSMDNFKSSDNFLYFHLFK